MDCECVLKALEIEIKCLSELDYSGHDYWHLYRVRKISRYIAEREGGDRFIIEAGALIHDVSDHKFDRFQSQKGKDVLISIFNKINIKKDYVDRLLSLMENVSYTKSLNTNNNFYNQKKPIEEKIVSDADRLDAIGAIGIARVFAFGGAFGKKIYDPSILPNSNISHDEYLRNRSSSVNHFYEKLLKLKDGMMTETGRLLAKERHEFMEKYLERFFKEWEIN